MLLVADIGNTNVHLGLYEGRDLILAGKFSGEQVSDIDAEWARFLAAARALSSLTALLPLVRVERVERAIGHNTVDALKSGLYFGLLGLVDALCERVAKELGADPAWIATGGDCDLLAGGSRFLKTAR